MPDPDRGARGMFGLLTGGTQQGGIGTPYAPVGDSGEIASNTPIYLSSPYVGGYSPYHKNIPSQYVMKSLPGAVQYGEAKNLPLQWMNSDPEKLSQFVNTGILRKAPGFKPGMGMPEILSAWDTLVQQAWTMNKAGVDTKTGNPWTPWDVLNTYSNEGMNYGTIKSGDWLIDARTGERIKYIGPKSKTTTEKRVDLSSPEDVRALTTQMLTELLGRAPTTKELASYRASINGYEEKNPQIATTTQTLNDMGEVVNTDTKTSGGTSQAARQALISEQAKQGPEYGKYQGGTTYFNAMMQMLGG